MGSNSDAGLEFKALAPTRERDFHRLGDPDILQALDSQSRDGAKPALASQLAPCPWWLDGQSFLSCSTVMVVRVKNTVHISKLSSSLFGYESSSLRVYCH